MLFWNQLTRPARIAIGGIGALLGLIFVGGLIISLLPKDTGPKKVAPAKLIPNGKIIKDSFGAC